MLNKIRNVIYQTFYTKQNGQNYKKMITFGTKQFTYLFYCHPCVSKKKTAFSIETRGNLNTSKFRKDILSERETFKFPEKSKITPPSY